MALATTKYTVKPGVGPKVVLPSRFGGRSVDFSTMTVEEADAFVGKNEGQDYLTLTSKVKLSASSQN